MKIEKLSLFTLPKEAQSIIAKLGKAYSRIIASNPSTDPQVIDDLAVGRDISTYKLALRRASKEVVESISINNRAKIESILWNPNCPEDIVLSALNSTEYDLALIAFLSPVVSEEERKKLLTPDLAQKMVEIGGNVGDRVVRAYSLVEKNKFMSDNPGIWSGTIKRAITGMPELTLEQSETIRKSGWSGWNSHSLHPVKSGRDIRKISVGELVLIGSSATDIEAMGRKDFTIKEAIDIVSRKNSDPEPTVLAELYKRYGVELAPYAKPIAGTRIFSSAWANPFINYIRVMDHSELLDYKIAISNLNGQEEEWKMFLNLINQWEGDIYSLSEAVKNI